MPISRTRMTTVTHHHTTPSSDSPMNAVPVRALSAMGSATLPKFVISPRWRAILPSMPSVTAARTKHRPGPEAPPRRVAAVLEEQHGVDGHEQEAQHRQRVGQVPVGGRGAGPSPRWKVCGVIAAPRRGRSPRCRRRRPARGRRPGCRGTLWDAHDGDAVDVGTLEVGPADDGAVLVVDLLDEDDDALTDALLGPLGVELLDEAGEAVEPLGDDLGGQLAGIPLRLGAVLVGVAEDADDVEACLGEEGLELARSASVSPGNPTMTLQRIPACGASARTRASRSRKASREPKRRIERRSGSDACWKEMS